MTKWHLVLIVVVVLASSCRQEAQFPVRPHSKRDTVEYFVSHADLVAIVEVADSSHLDTDRREGFQATVEAKLVEVFKGEALPGDDITLYRISPPTGPEKSMFSYPFAEGRHLVFLIEREESKGQYAPLTDMSVLSVYDGSVTPIWHRHTDTDEINIPGVTLERAIADVTTAIAKSKDTEQSAQPDKK